MKSEMANDLVKVLDKMHAIGCVTDETGGCDIKCELIQSDGECMFFSLKNVISELLGYEYVTNDDEDEEILETLKKEKKMTTE